MRWSPIAIFFLILLAFSLSVHGQTARSPEAFRPDIQELLDSRIQDINRFLPMENVMEEAFSFIQGGIRSLAITTTDLFFPLPSGEVHSVIDDDSFLFFPSDEKLKDSLLQSIQRDPGVQMRVNIITLPSSVSSVETQIGLLGGVVEKTHPRAKIITATLSGDRILELAHSPEVVSIWPDRLFKVNLDSSVDQINAPVMWAEGYTGLGIEVAVLDTGIAGQHPMLVNKVVRTINLTNDPNGDAAGHGTHVAGIIAGKRNGLNTYDGVAPDAFLWDVKVLGDTGIGYESDILAGIEFALDPDSNPTTLDGADILNLSFGGPYTSPNSPLLVKIQEAIDLGVMVVVSAGNCGSGCPSAECQGFIGVTSPGDAPHAITVGAVDSQSQWACFSSGAIIGNEIKPDLVAPGVDISSSSSFGGLISLSGTSMAAPHVSGIVALLLQSNPSLTPAEVKSVLENSAIDGGDPGKDVRYGSGLLDASQLLPSSVLTLLKYQVAVASNIITTGASQSITFTSVADDIHSLEATVILPNQDEQTIPLSRNGLVWTGVFSDTTQQGHYVVEMDIIDLSGTPISLSKTFITRAPSTTGAIQGFTLPSQVNWGQPIQASLDFENTGLYDTHVLVELQEWKEDFFERIYFSSPLLVPTGSTISIPVNWNPSASPGTKTIKLVAIFDDTALEVDQNVEVLDADPPVLHGHSLSSPSTSIVQPVSLKLQVGDISDVTAVVHVVGPQTSFDVNMIRLNQMDTNHTFEAYLPPSEWGSHSYSIAYCDSATPSNCDMIGPFSFEVVDCSLPKALIVAADRSAFTFLENAYCIGYWEDTRHPLSQSFVDQFPLVYWDAKSSFSDAINEHAVSILLDYPGNLVLAGDEIGYRHNSDELMVNRAHATFLEEISLNPNNPVALNIALGHYILQNIPSPIPMDLNQTIFPDAVTPINGGVALANWENSESGIVAFQDNDSKGLFLGFSPATHLPFIHHQTLLQNIFSWMFTTSGPDIVIPSVQTFFHPQEAIDLINVDPPHLTLFSQYLIEGINPLPYIVRNKGHQPAPNVTIDLLLDGQPIHTDTGTLDVNQSKRLTPAIFLPAGTHTLTIHANRDFGIIEPNSLNNWKETPIFVAPVLPNAIPVWVEGTYNDANGSLKVKAFVANFGGTLIPSLKVRFSINGITATHTITNIEPGTVASVSHIRLLPKGNYDVSIVVDPANLVTEADETDNTYDDRLFFCTEENVLLVNDDDASPFVDENASTAFLWEKELKETGYCVTRWDESTQGNPSPSFLNQFPLIVWSAGNYWSQSVDANDVAAIELYTGNILFEGNDIAFDHNDAFLHDYVGVRHVKDILLPIGAAAITPQSTSVFPTLAPLDLNGDNSGYPDAVLPFPEAFTAATWVDGNAAITALENFSRRLFFGFALGMVQDPAQKRDLVQQAMAWLAVLPNLPPSAPISITCDDLPCAGTYVNTLDLACSGSMDPENDALRYHLEASLETGGGNWWDSNWSHRVPISLTMSGPQTGFRTSIDLNQTILPDPAFWDNVQEDFQDIRFVHEGVLLKHYLMLHGPGAFASFWIELDAHAGANTIDMYWGNPSATYVGKTTPSDFFLTGAQHLVDDFENGSLDGWTIRSGSWQESGGILQRTGGSSSEDQITKDWVQQGSSFYLRAQPRPTSACMNTEIALTRDTDHTAPTYLDEYFGMNVDNACPNGYLYARVEVDQSNGTQNTSNSNPQVMVGDRTEVLISRTGWMGAFIMDANASAFVKVNGWEGANHWYPYLSVGNHGGNASESDNIYTGNAPGHAYDTALAFGTPQTNTNPSNWQEIGVHDASLSFAWDISGLGTQPNVGLRCRAIDPLGSGYYSPYYTLDQNIGLN
ncbi:MAG: DUF2341 domain-containing protein [Candidatus Diapherotrites archaeon]|nr:DUF2341 domain-containing protein [Candidatus Diapherotrites archaeon]